MMTYKAGCVSGWQGIRNHDDQKRLITVMCSGPAKHRTRAANPAELRRNKRHTEGAFSCLPSIMAAGVGTLRGGRPLSPVLATRTSPPPKPLTEAADSINTAQESNMSQDTLKGVTPEIHPPLHDRISQALTISLAATELLEKLAMDRMDPTARNLATVEDSLREAANLIYVPAQACPDSLASIQLTVSSANNLLTLAGIKPETLDRARKTFICDLLRGASDRLATINFDLGGRLRHE